MKGREREGENALHTNNASVLRDQNVPAKLECNTLSREEAGVLKVREILMFSSCALPERGRASATNVNKLTDFQLVLVRIANFDDSIHD